MEVEVNYLAVFLAMVASMIIGSIWYAKPVFGTMWSKLVHLDEAKMKQGAMKAMVSTVFLSLLTAYIMAHLIYMSHTFYNVSMLQAGISTAGWVWLGISMTTLVMQGLFEQRPAKLMLLNVGNQLVTLLAMGLVIGGLGV